MEILRLSLAEGAKQARGLAVIIDVFRAFTTAAYVSANGAKKIIPVASVDEALHLGDEHPDWILMGENHGHRIPEFDYGNSPAEVEHIDFTGQTVIQRTSSGTLGINLASGADEILLGSFVMADAIVGYIKRSRGFKVVSLVAMGWEGETLAIEDELCSEYIAARLQGESPDFLSMRRRIREDPSGVKFFDRKQSSFQERDFHLAMSLNWFNFALRVQRGRLPYYVQVS